MGKTTKSITVDLDVWVEAKAAGWNLSGEINSYLISRLSRQKGDIGGINIELERLREKKIQTKIISLQVDLKECLENIASITEIQELKKEKMLKDEKQAIKKEKHCINCNGHLSSKFHRFPGGNVCKVCYRSANKEAISRWNQIINIP